MRFWSTASARRTRARCKGFEGIGSLKGIGFAHFAAFLSRAYRENDYLLGRLHAVDRLIDIVCDSAGPECMAKIDVPALKQRAFTQVLDAEEKHLRQSTDLIAALRRCVAGNHTFNRGMSFIRVLVLDRLEIGSETARP